MTVKFIKNRITSLTLNINRLMWIKCVCVGVGRCGHSKLWRVPRPPPHNINQFLSRTLWIQESVSAYWWPCSGYRMLKVVQYKPTMSQQHYSCNLWVTFTHSAGKIQRPWWTKSLSGSWETQDKTIFTTRVMSNEKYLSLLHWRVCLTCAESSRLHNYFAQQG